MAATKAPTRPTPTMADRGLDLFYSVKAAARRLGIADPGNPDDESGERWLRDGFNRPIDGSQGQRFPGRYMSGRLIFSETDLVVIAEIALEETEAKKRTDSKPRPSTGRPRRVSRKTASAAA